MATRNDITGDLLKSKLNNENYENNFDAIFRKDKPKEQPKGQLDLFDEDGNEGLHYEDKK